MMAGTSKRLTRHADRALDLELLLLGATDQLRADLLQALHLLARERDADPVDLAHVGVAATTLLVRRNVSSHCVLLKDLGGGVVRRLVGMVA